MIVKLKPQNYCNRIILKKLRQVQDISFSCIRVVGYGVSLMIPWRRKDLSGLTVWDQISNEEAEARIRAAKGNAEA